MKPKVRDIVQWEATRGGYTFDELVGPRRSAHLCSVRHYAMWRARVETGRSYPEIAAVFNRDHSSVVEAVQKVDAMEPHLRGAFGARPRERVRVRPAATYIGMPCKKYGHTVRYAKGDACVECARIARAMRGKDERAA